MICLSAMFLVFKKLGNLGANEYTIITFYFFIAAAMLTVYSFVSKTDILPKNNMIWYLLILTAVLGAAGNIMLVKGLSSAPNPGYALAIVNANVILVTIGAFFLFGSEITFVKGIGIVLSLLGIILLGL